jgi:hypothetical protein
MMPHLPPDFAVYSADDTTALAGLGLGMKGLISVAGNLIPGPIARMVKAALDQETEEARAIYQKHFPLVDVLQCDRSPGPVKAALAMMGKCGETLRLPLAPVRDDSRRRIESRPKLEAGRGSPGRMNIQPGGGIPKPLWSPVKIRQSRVRQCAPPPVHPFPVFREPPAIGPNAAFVVTPVRAGREAPGRGLPFRTARMK